MTEEDSNVVRLPVSRRKPGGLAEIGVNVERIEWCPDDGWVGSLGTIWPDKLSTLYSLAEMDDLVCNVEKWASSLLIQHVADELGCDDRVVVCGKASGTKVVFRLKGDILVIRWSDRTGPSRDLKGVKARVYDVVRAAQARANAVHLKGRPGIYRPLLTTASYGLKESSGQGGNPQASHPAADRPTDHLFLQEGGAHALAAAPLEDGRSR